MDDAGRSGLALDGRLELVNEDSRCELLGRDRRLVLDLDRLGTVLRLLRQPAFARRRRRRSLVQADACLRHAGLTFELRLGHRTLARLGSLARPRAWSRALGLGPAELRPRAVLSALFLRPA